MEQQKKSKFLKGALIIGLVIVINLFFNYALSLIYPEPKYVDYCPVRQVAVVVDTQAKCLKEGGRWDGNIYSQYSEATKPVPAGYCDLEYTCRQTYETAINQYSRNVFVILIVLGAVILCAGVFMRRNPVVANGLSYAGVVSFVIASTRYWSSADKLVQVIILGVALGALIAVAVRKFND